MIDRYMLQYGKDKFGFTVSHTTRQPRANEVDGQHYHFTTVQDFKDLLKQDYFVEYAEVHGNWYGTSWSSVEAVQSGGKRCLLDIDVQGVKRIKTLVKQQQQQQAPKVKLDPKFIFIAPPSLQSLEDRLVNRKSEDPASLKRRLAAAAAEIEYGLMPDNFDAVVYNDDLDVAVRDLYAAITELCGFTS